MRIELAYARPDQQLLLALELPEGSTVSEAVEASALFERCPELKGQELTLGVWGQVEKSPGTRRLQDGERVEVYRALLIEPMAARKARAEKVRQQRARAAKA